MTESYVVHWIPAWARIVDVPTNRHRELQRAMDHTLGRLKTAAEGVRGENEAYPMITTYRAAPGIDVVTSSTAIPSLGSIAINAFVLHGEEPVLVDTGAVVQCEEFCGCAAHGDRPR